MACRSGAGSISTKSKAKLKKMSENFSIMSKNIKLWHLWCWKKCKTMLTGIAAVNKNIKFLIFQHVGVDLTETWMRSSREIRASDCQCQSRNSPGFDPSIPRHSRIRGAADEAVLNKVHKKIQNIHLLNVGSGSGSGSALKCKVESGSVSASKRRYSTHYTTMALISIKFGIKIW
jgi:hypothetical protein